MGVFTSPCSIWTGRNAMSEQEFRHQHTQPWCPLAQYAQPYWLRAIKYKLQLQSTAWTASSSLLMTRHWRVSTATVNSQHTGWRSSGSPTGASVARKQLRSPLPLSEEYKMGEVPPPIFTTFLSLDFLYPILVWELQSLRPQLCWYNVCVWGGEPLGSLSPPLKTFSSIDALAKPPALCWS